MLGPLVLRPVVLPRHALAVCAARPRREDTQGAPAGATVALRPRHHERRDRGAELEDPVRKGVRPGIPGPPPLQDGDTFPLREAGNDATIILEEPQLYE